MSNIVAIVGRPNVGKSTLYNRLTESRKAIVDDFSGVTRDRHYGVAEWTHHSFTVIDTGGYVANSEDVFEAAIREQVVIAIEEATVILFMVDVTTGITDLDDEIAVLLRRSKKPVHVVVNKVDNNAQQSDATVFYSLGLGEIYNISSMTGSGTGEGSGVRSPLFWRWMRPLVMPRTESTMTASMPSATWYCERLAKFQTSIDV